MCWHAKARCNNSVVLCFDLQTNRAAAVCGEREGDVQTGGGGMQGPDRESDRGAAQAGCHAGRQGEEAGRFGDGYLLCGSRREVAR